MNIDKSAPTVRVPQLANENEINLVDIISLLIRRKNIILGVMVVTVFIGFFHAFSQNRIYQVEAELLAPSFEQIQELNVFNSITEDNNNVNNSNIKISDVFETFHKNLNSRRMRYEFFDKHKILDIISGNPKVALSKRSVNDIFEGFSKSLIVEGIKAGKIKVSLKGTNKELIGNWLDDFIVMADKETTRQLVKNIQLRINSRIKSINIRIASKRSIYKQRNEDQLARLQEAHQIAKELNIIGHLFVPSVKGTSQKAVSAELNSISKGLSNEDNLSVYMKGTKVLQAEINVLKNRKSDDIHIVGLRDWQEQLSRLQSIEIDTKTIHSVIVDKNASIKVEVIGPKRKLIVILSLVLGGVFGIFGVFILEFLDNYKKQVNN